MPSIIPAEQWKPTTPETRSSPGARNPALLYSVIRQFSLETNPRYQPKGSTTYCNIANWDISSAMGCEIPHWYSTSDGAPVPVGKGAEMSANKMVDWLKMFGPKFGWKIVGLQDAVAAAQRGEFSLAIWKNPQGGPGHVATFTPDSTLTAPHIAQAGSQCFVGKSLASGFGSLPVQLWTHA